MMKVEGERIQSPARSQAAPCCRPRAQARQAQEAAAVAAVTWPQPAMFRGRLGRSP